MSLNASSFAPYVSSSSQAKAHHSYPFLSRNKSHSRTKAPPPDDPGYPSNQPSTSRFGRSSWFPTQPSTREVTSYQSGGVPTWETAIGGGSGANEEVESQMQNQWETRYGMRVDLLAAWAYVLGPISAFCMLIMETHNDFVRFHAYQSALLTTPLILLRILASLLQLSSVLRHFLNLLLVSSISFMAFRAHTDAFRNGLSRFHIPFIGLLAEQWLDEE